MIRVIKNSSSKLKNPTDKDFLRQIRIEKFENSVFIRYDVYFDIERIATFMIFCGTNYIDDVEIFHNKYKHKGLATFMYDYIEKDLEIKLQPSKAQTKEGKAFWQHRASKKPNPTDYSFLRLLKIEKRKLEFSNDTCCYCRTKLASKCLFFQ